MLAPRAEVPGCRNNEEVVVGLRLLTEESVVVVDVGVGVWRVWSRCLVGGELRGRVAARWMLVLVMVAVGVGVRGNISLLAFR